MSGVWDTAQPRGPSLPGHRMKGLNGAFRCRRTQPVAKQDPSVGALILRPRTHCWASRPSPSPPLLRSSQNHGSLSFRPLGFPQTPTVLAPCRPCQNLAPLVRGPRLSCFHQVRGPARGQAKEMPVTLSGTTRCSLASHLCRQGHGVGRPLHGHGHLAARAFPAVQGMGNRYNGTGVNMPREADFPAFFLQEVVTPQGFRLLGSKCLGLGQNSTWPGLQ